jgi:hypothetical protein
MKKYSTFMAGILSLLLVFGFALASCGDNTGSYSSSDTGSSDSDTSSDYAGITFTGGTIPSGNVYVVSGTVNESNLHTKLFGYTAQGSSIADQLMGTSKNKVTLMTRTGDSWTGSGTFAVIIQTLGGMIYYYKNNVSFSEGNATLSLSSMTKWVP